MRTNNQKLMEAFDHIDSRFVSEAMEYYRAEPSPAKTLQRSKRIYRYAAAAAVLAACVMLLVLAIPTVNIIVDNQDLFTPVMAENSEENSGGTVEYDGTRGLLYEVREDGETAAFVGFGNCTEETVVVATTYNGLPVVEMKMGNYWDHRNSGETVYMRPTYEYGNEYVKHLVISDTVETFDEIIIEACVNIESIYFGASVNKIIHPWTHENKIVSLEVSPENETYMSVNNCIIEIATKKLFRACQTSVIPDDGSIEVIGMLSCTDLPVENLVIPEGVKKIYGSAFSCCPNLKSAVLPKSLEYMGPSVFSNCRQLEVLDLNGFTKIADCTFTMNYNLTEVKGSENLVSIGHHAFSNCNSLKSISLGTCLEKIEKDAFSYFSSYWRDASIMINYAGTQAEWEAIEKEDEWNYRSEDLTVNCTDATINPEANMEMRGTPVQP